jgi:CHAT domain-containing protein
LPGDRPGTILLEEDFAIAVVPHGPFLLHNLCDENAIPHRPKGLVAVGGVDFDATLLPPSLKLKQLAVNERAAPVKLGGRLLWKSLPGTVIEVNGVAEVAARRKLDVELITGPMATAQLVLFHLQRARVAHLATHGFFADAEFRSFLQLDPNLFEMRGKERVGGGSLNPMVMSGLVFAGANNPDTPGRGLVTGEALVGLDLSGLELAVLSACETGLGDVAGGEGVFGLQKALHLAGCRNVVASLWKVDDDATAALMALFYHHLWAEGRPPAEALRRAQLALYRNPGLIATLAKRRGIDFTERDLPAAAAAPRGGPTAKTGQWAAFVLSGAGR